MRQLKNKKGFTLVEVIVVLVILALLAAVMIPAMTGWIDKAKEQSAIVPCRACVTAAQTLASEQYGLLGAQNISVVPQKVLELAGLVGKGDVSGIVMDGTDKALVNELTYTEAGTNGKSATYKRLPEPHYLFGVRGAAATPDAAFDQLRSVFDKVSDGTIKNAAGQKHNGSSPIDGINKDDPSTFAYAIYNQLSPEVKAFLDGRSWSIVKSSYGYRIYFTDRYYSDTESESPTKVYKYDPVSKQYQYTTEGKVENGRVKPDGNTWSDWSSTMD